MALIDHQPACHPYTLYGDKGSGSATVELALAEIGVDYEILDVQLDNDEQRGNEYGTINAQRKLPTLLTPQKETLTESAAILISLAERYPKSRLLPEVGSRERARAMRWLLFVATELYPIVEIIDYPRRFQPNGDALSTERCEEIRDHIREIWRSRWLLVEDAAQGSPWFLGSEFSVLDIYVAVISRWAQCREWSGTNLLRVEGIVAGIAAREKTAMTWQRHFG